MKQDENRRWIATSEKDFEGWKVIALEQINSNEFRFILGKHTPAGHVMRNVYCNQNTFPYHSCQWEHNCSKKAQYIFGGGVYCLDHLLALERAEEHELKQQLASDLNRLRFQLQFATKNPIGEIDELEQK